MNRLAALLLLAMATPTIAASPPADGTPAEFFGRIGVRYPLRHAFAPDGSRVAVVDERQLVVAEVGSARILHRLPVRETYNIHALAFSGDGATLVTVTRRMSSILPSDPVYPAVVAADIPSGRVRWKVTNRELDISDVTSIAFSPDGARVALAGQATGLVHPGYRGLQVRDTTNGRLVSVIDDEVEPVTGHSYGHTPYEARFSADGSTIRAFTYVYPRYHEAAWSADTGRFLGVRPFAEGVVAGYRMPGRDERVLVWSPETGEEWLLDREAGDRIMTRFSLPGDAPSVRVSLDGSRLLAATRDDASLSSPVAVYEVATGERLATFRAFDDLPSGDQSEISLKHAGFWGSDSTRLWLALYFPDERATVRGYRLERR